MFRKEKCKGENEIIAEGKGLIFETEKSKNKKSNSMNVDGTWNVINLSIV